MIQMKRIVKLIGIVILYGILMTGCGRNSDVESSGVDTAANQIVDFHGIRFSIPAYYTIFEETLTEDNRSYYTGSFSKELSALAFTAQDMELGVSKEEFYSIWDTLKQSISEVAMNKFFEGADASTIESSDMNVADLPGWTISGMSEIDGVPCTTRVCIVFDIYNNKGICITLMYRNDAVFDYDFDGDYQKILESAVPITKETIDGLVYRE